MESRVVATTSEPSAAWPTQTEIESRGDSKLWPRRGRLNLVTRTGLEVYKQADVLKVPLSQPPRRSRQQIAVKSPRIDSHGGLLLYVGDPEIMSWQGRMNVPRFCSKTTFLKRAKKNGAKFNARMTKIQEVTLILTCPTHPVYKYFMAKIQKVNPT